MQHTIDSIRRQAITAASLRHQTDASENRIREAAQQRLEAVEARLSELRPAVLTRPESADEYMNLTTERGQLLRVIEISNQRLGPSRASRDSTVQASEEDNNQ